MQSNSATTFVNIVNHIFGDYSPKARTFLCDYRDNAHNYYNRYFHVLPNYPVKDSDIINHIVHDLKKDGYTVYCINEMLNGIKPGEVDAMPSNELIKNTKLLYADKKEVFASLKYR